MEFPTGQKEINHLDGRKEIEFPDGLKEVTHKNGKRETFYPNGSQKIMHPNGDEIIYFKDGQKVSTACSNKAAVERFHDAVFVGNPYKRVPPA